MDCESFLSFLFIMVGVVLPLAVLVWTEPPASLQAWEQRRQSASTSASRNIGGGTGANAVGSRGSGSSGSSVAGSRASGGSGSHAVRGSYKSRGGWGSARAAASRAALLLEAGMRELCGRSWMAPAVAQQAQRGRQLAATSAAGPQQLARQLSADLEMRWSLAGWQRGIAWWLLISIIWGMCRLHHSMQLGVH